MIGCCSGLNQKVEKSKRVLDLVEYVIEHKELPKGDEVKRLAEEYGVPARTLYDDIRKMKEGNLGDKVLEVLSKRLEDAADDVEAWRNGDLIKLYQATRSKKIESKIDLKAEIDIRGDAIGEALKEFGDIIKREAIHEERVSES